MTLSGYLSDHWGILILLIGIALILRSDVHLERRIIRRIALANAMLFLYSVTCYIETYLGNQPVYTVVRPILSALNYSLITFILVVIITIMYPEQKFYLYFPAVLNAALCFISIPTKIVFYISEDNHFFRGTLGYLTYFINALYLVYLICNLFRKRRAQKEDYRLLLFVSATSVMCLVMPLFMEDAALHWFNLTIATNVLLYYVFLLQQFTKRDSLTQLLNRQSYYADAEKYAEEITAVVTMDMDGLKEINDNEGHVAGDTALKTLADCFWKAAQEGQRVYRIGGDEYAILCINTTEEEVRALMERIRNEVAKTPYDCSAGYAMKTDDSSIDRLYQLADAMMFEEKKQFYERTGRNRRRNR